jgi:hypothetical protein
LFLAIISAIDAGELSIFSLLFLFYLLIITILARQVAGCLDKNVKIKYIYTISNYNQ